MKMVSIRHIDLILAFFILKKIRNFDGQMVKVSSNFRFCLAFLICCVIFLLVCSYTLMNSPQLTRNLKMSELSVAYVSAIASSAGFATDFRRIDNDSVDIVITSRGKLTDKSTKSAAELKIQLKATCNWKVNEKDNTITFQLPKKNYEDLRVKRFVPIILVVLFLPKSDDEWVVHSDKLLQIFKCAHWLSLSGSPASKNNKKISIKIPYDNHFSQKAVKSILEKISEEDWT